MTTTYTSTNNRPCADCGLRVCPAGCGSLGLLTSILPASAILTGEIRPGLDYTITYVEDGSHVTVPIVHVEQPVIDYVTMSGVIRAIEKGPQNHRAGRRVPVGPVACVFIGLVLMAICAVWFTVVLPLGLYA